MSIHTQAQTQWVTKILPGNIELKFPKEPIETDYGENHIWLLFHDSTLFQFNKVAKEEKEAKTNYRSCQLMLNGLIEGCKGTLLRSDSAKLNGFCAIYFTVKPTASPLENFLIKGFTLDVDGKSYILAGYSEKKNFADIDKFIASFKLINR